MLLRVEMEAQGLSEENADKRENQSFFLTCF